VLENGREAIRASQLAINTEEALLLWFLVSRDCPGKCKANADDGRREDGELTSK
jgi:hypothetical protein